MSTVLARRTVEQHEKAPIQIPRWTDKFFHDDTPAGAGFHGLEEGRKRGYLNADMNFNACKPTPLHPNGVLINTHWRRTGHDHFTSRAVKRDVAFSSLPWRKVKKLRAPGGWRVRSIKQIITHAARLGYTHLEIELKDGVDHLTHAQLVALVKAAEKVAERVGIQIYWKTLSNIGDPLKRIKAVHEGGGITVLLPRDNPHLDKAEWWPVLDYRRGQVTWK